MAIALSSIKTGREIVPPRLLIYGLDGIGKSTWAASAPSPIFTQTEDRLSHIACDRFPLCETFEQAIDNLSSLYEEDHDYCTHVTDSVDWLEKLIHKSLCEEFGEKVISSNAKGSGFSYGRGYVLAEEKFRTYLAGLEALRSKKRMQIILIAHTQVKRFEDPMRDSYDQYRPNLHERICQTLLQWVDCAFFANFDVLVKSEKDDYGKEKKKGIGRGDRILYTEERPAYEAKNSYDMPPQMPLEYSAFEAAYNEWKNK